MPDFISSLNTVNGNSQITAGSQNADDSMVYDVDMSVLRAYDQVQSEGEPDLVITLIDLYLDSAPQQLQIIKDSVANEDIISLKNSAHSLKGSSANMGADYVAELCEKLEQASAPESFEQARLILKPLEKNFERARAMFLAERESRLKAADKNAF